MSVVERIKRLCDKKKITFAELERLLGFGHGAIARWDTNMPSGEKLLKVAEYFDCTTDYLLGITTKPDRIAPAELQAYGVEWVSLVKHARAAGLTAEQLDEFIKTIEKLK